MSALLEFANWVKAAGPSVAAGVARNSTHGQQQSAQLQAEVTKRLATLLGPCKEAMSNNGPAAAQVHSYLDAVKKHVSHRDFEQAAQDLDKLEELVGESKPSKSGIGADDGKPAAGANPSTPGSPSAAEAGSEADVACAPPATSTDLFFCKDSAELTASDKQSLADYARAYLAAMSSEPIVVDAYASSEGDAGHNVDLSKRRGQSVVEYLVKVGGVPKDKVKGPIGHGATDMFSKTDSSQNRRATIKPPAPGSPTTQPAGGADGSGGTGSGGGSKGRSIHDDVYNPGDTTWPVILGNNPAQKSHSAGAIRKGTKYDDYTGWQDRDYTVSYNEDDHDIHLTFTISAQIRGHPKDDPDTENYVANVRVSGDSKGRGGFVDANVEDAAAKWWDGFAAVFFMLVIRIQASSQNGGKRRVEIAVRLRADEKFESSNHPRVVPTK